MAYSTTSGNAFQFDRTIFALRQHELQMKATPAAYTSFIWDVLHAAGKAISASFGVVVAAVVFGALGVLPILQFIPLGYLFRTQRRIACRGGVSVPAPYDVDILAWSRLGARAFGWGLVLLPLVVVGWIVEHGEILEPGALLYSLLRGLLPLFWGIALLHLVVAELRGGGRRLLDPWGGLKWLLQMRADEWPRIVRMCVDTVWEVADWGWQLFLLGVRGYVALIVWLLPSAMLLYFGSAWTWCEILSGVLLGLVTPFVLLGSVRFAVEDHIWAAWEIKELARRIYRAPWSIAIALLAMGLLTLPLYFLTFEQPAWDTGWILGTLAFLMVWPARMIAAWAYTRTEPRSATRRLRVMAVPGLFCVLLLAAAYSLQMFYVQGWTWQGARIYFDQHSFLLPNLH